jgi:glutamate N-acetyltransferase/amino-acid N-acetyltransferase
MTALRPVFALPSGFRAAAVAAGIKKSGGLDVALLVSDAPDTAVAATYTTNQVRAAPVRLDQERTAGGRARAIAINAGNANACTGAAGLEDARRMAAFAAQALGLPEESVLVCSTGRIGARLPMDKIEAGLRAAAAALDDPEAAAQVPLAIMTTDTRPKQVTVDLVLDGRPVRLAACAKGAGMIEPNMATMLGYLLTDAAVAPADWLALLRTTVHDTFNRVSVDGDTSTNDTVIALANGRSGVTLAPGSPGWEAFAAAFRAVCMEMAIAIVRDGEGVTKFITLEVSGARSDAEADAAARSVANSYLVKTGWAGTYPVWGRIMDALGYSPATVDETRVSIDYDQVPVARGGVFAGSAQADLDAVTRSPAYTIRIDLGLGPGRARVYTCDCTEEYVRINMF